MGYLLGVQYSFVMEVILYFFPIRGKGSHEVQSVFKLYYLHTHSFLAIQGSGIHHESDTRD